MTAKKVLPVVAVLVGVILVVGTIAVSAHRGEERERNVIRIIHRGGHPWLGVQVSDLTPEKAKELQLTAGQGVLITEVMEESPAAEAGFEVNDVVLEFAGEGVRSATQFARLVRETPSGTTVPVQVRRGGEMRTLTATPQARRARLHRPPIPQIQIPHIEIPEVDVRLFSRGPRLGISGDELTPQLAEYFAVKSGKGVLVREVLAGSAAEKAGLKAGDVIVRVGEREVGSLYDLRRALRQNTGESRPIELTLVRDRRERTVTVELPEEQLRAPRRTAVAPPPVFVPAPDGEFNLDYEYDDSWVEEGEQDLESIGEEVEQNLEQRLQELERKLEELEPERDRGVELQGVIL